MKARFRYLIALLSIGSILLLFHLRKQRNAVVKISNGDISSTTTHEQQNTFVLKLDVPWAKYRKHNASAAKIRTNPAKCVSYDDPQCFDLTKCGSTFLVSIYPPPADLAFELALQRETRTLFELYDRFLHSVKRLHFYTSDASRACLLIPGYDTLDRDRLSLSHVHGLHDRLQSQTLWRRGLNYVIFTLFAGTYPAYAELDLGFDTGSAILARASASYTHFRSHFDVSLPLVQAELPQTTTWVDHLRVRGAMTLNRSRLVTFKGKRYLWGIGSEQRSSLHHLEQRGDVLILTTCRHGDQWQRHSDRRCEADNQRFDLPQHEYQDLMRDSQACLVPRGRRLGSFRLLEALRFGCIPVVLDRLYVLPFGSVLTWPVLRVNETQVFQTVDLVRSLSKTRLADLRHRCLQMYSHYFSSIEKIVQTTLEVLHDRLYVDRARPEKLWNGERSALWWRPDFSLDVNDYPLYSNRPRVDVMAAVLSCDGLERTRAVEFLKRLGVKILILDYTEEQACKREGSDVVHIDCSAGVGEHFTQLLAQFKSDTRFIHTSDLSSVQLHVDSPPFALALFTATGSELLFVHRFYLYVLHEDAALEAHSRCTDVSLSHLVANMMTTAQPARSPNTHRVADQRVDRCLNSLIRPAVNPEHTTPLPTVQANDYEH